jgi:predicted alpha/beta superfamily hydrolase
MLVIVPASHADSGGFDHIQTLRNVEHHTVHSDVVDRDYYVSVRLPNDYDENEASYPTIYVLDGGALFPLFAGYLNYLNFAEEVPPIILVGISYGADNFADGNFRGTDYTAPSPEREHYGGAANFLTFLKEDVLPLIEKNYRSDSDRRVVFGHSLGGQFVLFAAQTDPGAFWGYVASNPALHRNLDFFLTTTPTQPSKSKLFVASAEFDDARFREPAVAWMQHWNQQEELPWSLKTMDLDDHVHMSSPPDAFRQGMRWLFGSDD